MPLQAIVTPTPLRHTRARPYNIRHKSFSSITIRLYTRISANSSHEVNCRVKGLQRILGKLDALHVNVRPACYLVSAQIRWTGRHRPTAGLPELRTGWAVPPPTFGKVPHHEWVTVAPLDPNP